MGSHGLKELLKLFVSGISVMTVKNLNKRSISCVLGTVGRGLCASFLPNLTSVL